MKTDTLKTATGYVFRVLNEDWRPILKWCEDFFPTMGLRKRYDWWWENAPDSVVIPGERYCDMNMIFIDTKAAMTFKLFWNEKILQEEKVEVEIIVNPILDALDAGYIVREGTPDEPI